MVITEAFSVASLGSIVGLAGAYALSRVLRSLLYGVAPTDPMSFAFSAGLLAVLALSASYFPARRAMSVDPIVVLRSE